MDDIIDTSVSSYISRLEDQNEELKERLAEAEEKIEKLESVPVNQRSGSPNYFQRQPKDFVNSFWDFIKPFEEQQETIENDIETDICEKLTRFLLIEIEEEIRKEYSALDSIFLHIPQWRYSELERRFQAIIAAEDGKTLLQKMFENEILELMKDISH